MGGQRRVRTLGLGATVRHFNELAVPGLGGVWFGKQVVLALLGVHLAETLRSQGRGTANIAAANAVEALAVWWTLSRTGWSRDPRLPGSLKLRRYPGREDPSFKLASGRAFYVSQPMRIGTRDALPMLGLVAATNRQFNSYSITESGRALLEIVCPKACKALQPWASGGDLPGRKKMLSEQLDPTSELPHQAREILRAAFLSGRDFERSRRRQALAFVERLQPGGHTSWNDRPTEITDHVHWADMRAGAELASAMEAAAGEGANVSVLGKIEARMGAAGVRKLSLDDAVDTSLAPALDRLRSRARTFVSSGYDPSPERAAGQFCRECIEPDPKILVASLVARDGRILRLIDGSICAGSAFKGQPFQEPDPDEKAEVVPDEGAGEAPDGAAPPLPEGISRRIHNLASLAPDLSVAARDDEGV